MTAPPPHRVATVVLAAGSGRRFGGSKLTQELGDTTVIERVLHTASILPSSRTVIVIGAHQQELAPILSRYPELLAVHNPDHEAGIASSLARGIAAVHDLHPPVACAIVLLGDEPGVPAAALEVVAQRALRSGLPARASYHGGIGHPVALPRASWDAVLTEVAGDAGARATLEGLGVQEVPIDTPRPGDIDRPSDLARLRLQLIAPHERARRADPA